MAAYQDLGGGRWKVTVSLGRDADGHHRRVTKRIAARGIREARRLGAEWEAGLPRVHVDRLRSTVDAVAEEWLTLWAAGGHAPATELEYRRIVRQYVTGTELGERLVRDVRPGDLDVWYSGLRSSRGEVLSAATKRRIHAVVRQVFEHAERRGLVTRSPAARVRLPPLRPKEGRFPTEEEIAAVVSAAWEVSPVRARLLVFAAGTGLRRGELAAVRWSRLDLTAGEVMVAESVSQVGGRLIVKDPKAHQALSAEITPSAVRAATGQMAWQLAEAGDEIDADPYLWAAEPPFGRPMWPSTFSAWMAAARRRSGVEHVRLHDLRHWHGSEMNAQGASLADIQRQLRHRTMATTMIYVHAGGKDRRRELVGRLPALELPGHGGGSVDVQE